MREAAMTNKQKTDETLYGSYAPRVRGCEVTTQSKDGSRTKGGGAAMKSKNPFGSVMLVLVAALIALATPGFLADRAWAEKVSISGKYSCAQLKSLCTGKYIEGESNCDCFTTCQKEPPGECRVTCYSPAKNRGLRTSCDGFVPVRTQPKGSLSLGDALRGARPAVKQR